MASSAIQRRSVSWRAPGSRPAASPARTSAARSRVPRQAGSLSTFRSAPIVPMLSAGFIGSNAGTISNSHATGAVLGLRQAGGFAGDNHGGTITSSTATGPVTGIDNALLGGFVATNDGSITQSSATGTVAGANTSILGGFAAVNSGMISISTSSGTVIGSSESYLGGLVGVNTGLIKDSTSSSTVIGIGSHNFAGGLVGINFGLIDPSHSSGNVTSGPDSTVGSFVGANAAIRFPNGSEFIGTISPDSNGTGTATAGPNSTVGPQVGQSYPTSGTPDLPAGTCGGNSNGFCGGTLFNPNGGDQR